MGFRGITGCSGRLRGVTRDSKGFSGDSGAFQGIPEGFRGRYGGVPGFSHNGICCGLSDRSGL